MRKLIYLYIAIAMISVSSCTNSPSHAKYKLTPKQTLENALKTDNIISPENLVQILCSDKKGNENYVFVDVRTPQEFIEGHVEGAINIPFVTLVNKETDADKLFSDKVNIIYGKTSDQAVIAASILTQIGQKNIMVCTGSYDFIKKHILKSYSILSGNYYNEKALYDYAKVVAETQGLSVGAPAVSSSPAPVAIGAAPVKKKKSGGGGCE